MLPIVTLNQLLDALETLTQAGYRGDEQVVLTTRENAGSIIGLGVVEIEGYGISPIPGVQFSGIEEL